MSTTTNAAAETRTAAARRHGTQAALGRVHDVLTRMRRDRIPVSVAAVARADVSRTFVHENAGARAAVAEAIQDAGQRRAQALDSRNAECEAPWRERALNAEDGLKVAHEEVLRQRTASANC